MEEVIGKGNEVLMGAFLKHPERFKGRILKASELREEAWINLPKLENDISYG